jgi:hypothetical protein
VELGRNTSRHRVNAKGRVGQRTLTNEVVAEMIDLLARRKKFRQTRVAAAKAGQGEVN